MHKFGKTSENLILSLWLSYIEIPLLYFKHNFVSFPSSQSLLHIPTGFASILVGMQEEWGLLSRINVPTIKSNIACTYIEAVFDTWDEVAANCPKVEIISTYYRGTTVTASKKTVQFPRGDGLGRKKVPAWCIKQKKSYFSSRFLNPNNFF